MGRRNTYRILPLICVRPYDEVEIFDCVASIYLIKLHNEELFRLTRLSCFFSLVSFRILLRDFISACFTMFR